MRPNMDACLLFSVLQILSLLSVSSVILCFCSSVFHPSLSLVLPPFFFSLTPYSSGLSYISFHPLVICHLLLIMFVCLFVTPLLIDLHWLPVAARIKFKSLMLAYRVLDGSATTYLNVLVRANVTPRMLHSSSERRLALPSVQVRQSRLFSFVVPRWWNELPSTTRAGASLSTFKKLLKTQLFREHFPS